MVKVKVFLRNQLKVVERAVLQLQSLLTCDLHGGVWPHSHPGRFNPVERNVVLVKCEM
jgi:hypothetical protein